jgi:hypothetical protein
MHEFSKSSIGISLLYERVGIGMVDENYNKVSFVRVARKHMGLVIQIINFYLFWGLKCSGKIN